MFYTIIKNIFIKLVYFLFLKNKTKDALENICELVQFLCLFKKVNNCTTAARTGVEFSKFNIKIHYRTFKNW